MTGEGASRTVFTVSQINEYVRMVLDRDAMLRHVWIRGEISNFTNHYKTGHFYFSLKDETCSLRAVMFRADNRTLKFVPENGMRVLAHGEVRTYVRDGQTQIVVDEMQPDGAGSLALAFEQIRRRLEAEGLFDPARKKTLPPYPRRIGVITSPTGAAIHDIIRIAGRRYPLAELILYPALVQGEGAAESLRSGVEFFNLTDIVDEIIIGRGGGSAEDLWAFNDEALARTIAVSRLPVISAVGHESDVTICDFVADLRAPTPSGAAELAVPDATELRGRIADRSRHMDSAVDRRLALAREMLDGRAHHRLLLSPKYMLEDRRLHLGLLETRLDRAVGVLMAQKCAALSGAGARLDALSPLSVLGRGFAMVHRDDESMVTTLAALHVGEQVRLQFADGYARARIEDKHPETGKKYRQQKPKEGACHGE